MEVDEKEYNDANMRTLDKMRKCRMAKGINKVKGCVKPPLFEIEPENCVIDELHLFLRISDVLFENLFAELQRLSLRAKTHRTGEPSDHVERAVSAIRRSGVSFNVWLSKEGTRQSRSGLEMTSLNRNEKLKVMNSLPDCFDDFLPSDTAVSLKTLWRNFLKIYKQLSSEAPDLNMLETESRVWIKDFLSLATTLEGHQKSSVTPYMHVFAYHVPDQIRRHGNIRRFSGQGN